MFLSSVTASTGGWEDETAADFFRKYGSIGTYPVGTLDGAKAAFGDQNSVAKMVAEKTRAKLGPEWVESALKIAKLESSFRCNALGPRTRHGRAAGIFQVMPGSAKALGYDYNLLTKDCAYSIEAGLAHMKKCLDAGATSFRAMSACHVAGWGNWNRKLARKSEKYRAEYIKMASAQNIAR
jgi:hypothetical protein